MNLRYREMIPASNFMPVFLRGSTFRRLILLLPAALLLFALPPPANAASVEVQQPGVSVEVNEESQEVDVSLPGLSVAVLPAETRLTQEGEVLDLSGTWKFKEDLEEKGHLTGWQSPEFDDSAWRTIRVPADWEKEGVITPNPSWRGYQPDDAYNGYGWYRRHFAVPAEWAGATVRLHFGAIDDWDWTYVNGQLVGTTTGDRTWDDPRDYVLPPDILKPGEDNVIAVRVCDMGGGGGISEAPVELLNTSVPPAVGEPTPTDTRFYSQTRSEVVQFGSDVSVDSDEKVSGNVVVFGGSADIRGRVTGDVVAVGGTIHLRPGARVDGDVVAVAGAIDRSDGAVVSGDTVTVGPGLHLPRANFTPRSIFDLHWGISGLSATLLGLLAWGFIGLLGVLLMKDRLGVMADALPAHPARAALYGLIGFALVPAALLTATVASILASVLLAITIIGIPLIPAVFAALLALIFAGGLLVVAGVIAVWFTLGRATLGLFNRQDVHPIWAVLIGLALIGIVSHLPMIGPLIVVTVIILGFGLAIMTGIGANSQWAHRRLGFKSAQAVPPTPATPPPTAPPAPPAPTPPAPPALTEETPQPQETEPGAPAEPQPGPGAPPEQAATPDLGAEPEPTAETEGPSGEEIEDEPEAERRDS